MAEARYPVFVLGKCALAAAVVMLPEKPSAVPNKQRLPMHRTVNG